MAADRASCEAQWEHLPGATLQVSVQQGRGWARQHLIDLGLPVATTHPGHQGALLALRGLPQKKYTATHKVLITHPSQGGQQRRCHP